MSGDPRTAPRTAPSPRRAGGTVRAFMEITVAVRALLADPALAARWDEPSILSRLSVRGLAGHLLRAIGTVEAYLDADPVHPDEDHPAGPAAYFLAVLGDADLDSAVHHAIRDRGEAAAAAGPGQLLADWDACSARLAVRLPTEPDTRLVKAAGVVLRLDDYLATRLVELCVHADDLATSLDRPTPTLPSAATETAIGVLVEMARLRHGDVAVLRALARRERDTPRALQVM